MAQMYDHQLNATKGWPSPSALDYSAKKSADVDYDLRAGQVCHLNADGELEPGCRRWQVPLFIFQGSTEFDTDNSSQNDEWYPITPSGNIMCLVGLGAYELWTTEFDTTLTYAVGDPLRSPVGNTSGDELLSGILTNADVLTVVDTIASAGDKYTNICGIATAGIAAGRTVTGPEYTNAYGKAVLAFWPVWFPGHPTE